MYFEEYRVDALRIDAVHAIADDSPRHIVADLAELGQVIAESDLGDVKVIDDRGWACDAQWADDLHHALHAVVTGERSGYYADFGSVADVAYAIERGFVYTGQPSRYRKQKFGTPAKHLPGEKFVVCAQNHDQIGNRARGERIGHIQPGCEYAVAATYLLAPAVPLIFMGEEHGESSPFLYFTDHGDESLKRAVSEGRRREFGLELPSSQIPDPQDPDTFERSRIHHELSGSQAALRGFYQALLALRHDRRSLRELDRARTITNNDGRVLEMRRYFEDEHILLIVNLSTAPATWTLPAGSWSLLADAGAHGGPATGISGDTLELERFAAVLLGAGPRI